MASIADFGTYTTDGEVLGNTKAYLSGPDIIGDVPDPYSTSLNVRFYRVVYDGKGPTRYILLAFYNDPTKPWVLVKPSYHQEFINLLKGRVPSTDRRWNPEGKYWLVKRNAWFVQELLWESMFLTGSLSSHAVAIAFKKVPENIESLLTDTGPIVFDPNKSPAANDYEKIKMKESLDIKVAALAKKAEQMEIDKTEAQLTKLQEVVDNFALIPSNLSKFIDTVIIPNNDKDELLLPGKKSAVEKEEPSKKTPRRHISL